jgi:Cu(I)/Ag(I) efflux system membrane fusion protein
MKVLGMTDAQIAELGRRREARRLVTVYAPRSGSVLRLNVRAGAAVDPSVELMAVADLSHVWVIAELPEHDAAHVSVGTPARLAFAGLPEGSTESNVTFVYPTLTPGSRTVRVRFDVANPGPLRPGSYGTAIVQAPKRHVLTVPRDAVVDTGIEQHVFVVGEGGALVPRTVRTGARFEERVEIRSGIESGERVVVSGVFLIDSESRLRASGGTGHAHGADDAEQEAPRDPHAGH